MEIAQWIFFGPAKLVALEPYGPYLGLAIAITLILVQVALNMSSGSPFDKSFFRKAPVFSGLLWLIFGLYERQMQAVMLMTSAPKINAEPMLRLDLIVLTPILYLLSVAAIYSIWRAVKGKTH
jgi:hypothetical protein